MHFIISTVVIIKWLEKQVWQNLKDDLKCLLWEYIDLFQKDVHVCSSKNLRFSQAVVAHAFNPSTWETEASGSLSYRPAWSTRASSRTVSKTTVKPCNKQKQTNKQEITFRHYLMSLLRTNLYFGKGLQYR